MSSTVDVKSVPVKMDSYEKIQKERAEKLKKEKSNPYGKDTFLQLLVSQMRHQNPLEPMKNEEFMAQMAQFTTVEQITNLTSSFEDYKKSMEVIGEDGKTQNLLVNELKILNKNMGKYMGTITPAETNTDFLKTMSDFVKKYDENTKNLLARIESLESEIKKLSAI